MSSQRSRGTAPGRRRVIGLALPVVALAAVLVSGCTGSADSTSVSPTGSASSPDISSPASTAPTPVCGQPILDSRWHYDGAPGTFRAQQAPAGLPTFGSPGSDFPGATQIIVVPAGNNTAAAGGGAYNVDHAVVYFDPGIHQIENVMYTGHDTAYVGGYTPAAGKAVLDGVNGATGSTGKGGSRLANSTPSSGNNVYDTWEYLTIKNFTSSLNNSVMGNVNGGASDVGDVYQYDTIGPNEYGFQADDKAPGTGQSSGGGYAIDASSNTTIAHNCLTRNAQGAFNISDATNINIEANEISWNGIGVYPDGAGSGASPFACGCSGGGKIFFSLNANVAGNYVHDNYNTGIWFDFDNAGAAITHNYVASNWGSGISLRSQLQRRHLGQHAGGQRLGIGWLVACRRERRHLLRRRLLPRW